MEASKAPQLLCIFNDTKPFFFIQLFADKIKKNLKKDIKHKCDNHVFLKQRILQN